MKAFFEDEFERKLIKATRRFCEKTYTMCSRKPMYWQFVYNNETFFSTTDIYERLVHDKKIEPFAEHIINEHYKLND